MEATACLHDYLRTSGNPGSNVASAIAGTTSMPFGPSMPLLIVKNVSKKSLKRLNSQSDAGLLPRRRFIVLTRLSKISSTTLRNWSGHMIGADENPSFHCPPAIRSRVQILSWNLCLTKTSRSSSNSSNWPWAWFDFSSWARWGCAGFHHQLLVRSSLCLQHLTLAVLSTPENDKGIRHITLDIMENSLQRSYITMDKDGDGHYDVLSFKEVHPWLGGDASLHCSPWWGWGSAPSVARRWLLYLWRYRFGQSWNSRSYCAALECCSKLASSSHIHCQCRGVSWPSLQINSAYVVWTGPPLISKHQGIAYPDTCAMATGETRTRNAQTISITQRYPGHWVKQDCTRKIRDHHYFSRRYL